MIEHIGSAPVPFASTENIADDPFTRAAVASLVETTLHNIALTGAIGFGEIALGGELISQIAFHNADALTALNRIENHDPYTVIHSLNVCALALCIAYVDGIDESAAENLATAALLHDIRKNQGAAAHPQQTRPPDAARVGRRAPPRRRRRGHLERVAGRLRRSAPHRRPAPRTPRRQRLPERPSRACNSIAWPSFWPWSTSTTDSPRCGPTEWPYLPTPP